MSLFEPRQGTTSFLNFEVPDLRVDNQGADVRRNLQERTVCHNRNSVDLPVMLEHKLEVRGERGEVTPAGERLHLDHQTRERSALSNECTEFVRKALEIRFLKWTVR
jgi:hypothetical protein